jgi:hypothetical protein
MLHLEQARYGRWRIREYPTLLVYQWHDAPQKPASAERWRIGLEDVVAEEDIGDWLYQTGLAGAAFATRRALLEAVASVIETIPAAEFPVQPVRLARRQSGQYSTQNGRFTVTRVAEGWFVEDTADIHPSFLARTLKVAARDLSEYEHATAPFGD